MSRESWRDMVSGYVLDALEPAERADFEAHLATDAELRAAVDDARASLLAVAEALPDAAPPPRLKARLLERARADRPTSAPGAPRDRQPTKRPLWGRPGAAIPWLLLAASVAGLVWLGSNQARLTGESLSLSQQLAEARSSLATAEQSLAEAEITLARFDSLALALAGPDIRFANLTGDAAPGLRLFWNQDRGVMVVAADNLPSAPPGRTFQLWGIRGAESPVSLGTFDVEPTGSALLTLSAGPAEYDVSALTEEPVGGSPQPTSAPFLVGAWTTAGG